MKPIALTEILNVYEYEKVREARRRELIGIKTERRVQVGRYLSFVFENRETVWFQIQEMVRAERIVDDDKILDVCRVYSELLPQDGELAATLFIEIGDAAAIKPVLDALLGIDTRDYVRLEVGPHVVVGRFETGRSDEELGKLSAVHFVRFALPEAVSRAFPAAEVALVIDHPNERARTVLSPETKASLGQDLV
jgi:hypothetical protein